MSVWESSALQSPIIIKFSDLAEYKSKLCLDTSRNCDKLFLLGLQLQKGSRFFIEKIQLFEHNFYWFNLNW